MVLDLEKQLKEDRSGSKLDSIVDQLESINSHYQARLRTGLSSDEYTVASAYSEALTTAQTVVKSYWGQLHKT